jgi:hypothetical protein
LLSFLNGVLTITGDILNPNRNDTFTLEVDGITHKFLQYSVNGAVNLTLLSSINQIVVQGGGGDDQLIVDVSNGLINIPISYDGGAGFNTLTLDETTSTTAETSETYDVGAVPGMGIDTIVGPTGTQSVEFQNLSPVTSLVPAGSLTVEPASLSLFGISGSILNSSNTVSYTQGLSPAFGQISIDNAEPFAFSGKGSLTIATGPGTDTINLDNPSTPSGASFGDLMQSVAVAGGDPSAGDTLVVNAVPTQSPDSLDTLEVTPTGAGAGTISHANGLNPTVSFSGMGHVRLVGQATGGTVFGVDGTIGNDQFEYAPGATPDAGVVLGTMDQNNATGAGPFPLVPITFSGMSQTLAGPGLPAPGIFFDTANQVGGRDTLVYDGTSGNDSIAVTGGGTPGSLALEDTVNGLTFSSLFAENLHLAVVNGNGGDDVATVSGNTVPVTVNRVSTLDAKGTGVGGTTVDLGARTVQEAGFSAITAEGASSIIVDATGKSLSVAGPTGPNNVTYDSTGRESGRLISDAGEPVVTFTNVGGMLTLAPGDVSGTLDQVSVEGTAVDNTITAIGGVLPVVEVNGLKPLTIIAAETANVRIDPGNGNDTFVVDSSSGAFPIPIHFDGGTGDNRMILTGGFASSDTASFGLFPGSGSSKLVLGGVPQSVSYINLNQLIDVVAGSLAVNGTATNDIVNYETGDDPSLGMVTVDAFTPVEFSNKSVLVLSTGAGDDTISLDNPFAPAGLGAIAVVGGVGDDTLNVNARGHSADVSVAGLIGLDRLPPVTYSGVEQINVVNTGAPVLATAPVQIRGVAGMPLFRVPTATFTAALTAAEASSLSATIDWGDGTAPSPGAIIAVGTGQFEILGSHTYAQVGTPVVTTSIAVPGGPTTEVVGGVPITITPAAGASATIVSTDVLISSSASSTLTGKLSPSSDSGASRSDAITNVTRPTFTGTFEPHSSITLFARSLSTGATQVIGHGSTNSRGAWTIKAATLANDGYVITVSGTNTAKQLTASTVILPASHPLVIDTVGPRITSAEFDRLTGVVTLILQDNLSGLDPSRFASSASYAFMNLATHQKFALSHVTQSAALSGSTPLIVSLTYNNGNMLPPGVYTLTVRSGAGSTGLRDLAGNALDGEFTNSLPSGNGVPGGNFVGNFNVSTVPSAHATPPSVVIVGNPPPPTTIVVRSTNRSRATIGKTSPHVRKAARAHDAALAALGHSSRRIGRAPVA